MHLSLTCAERRTSPPSLSSLKLHARVSQNVTPCSDPLDRDLFVQDMLRRGINAQGDDDEAAQFPVNLSALPVGMLLEVFVQQENVRREIK